MTISKVVIKYIWLVNLKFKKMTPFVGTIWAVNDFFEQQASYHFKVCFLIETEKLDSIRVFFNYWKKN